MTAAPGSVGGARLSKADPRVEAYGGIDELNAVLGWVRAARLPEAMDRALEAVQHGCFQLGAWLACAAGQGSGDRGAQ